MCELEPCRLGRRCASDEGFGPHNRYQRGAKTDGNRFSLGVDGSNPIPQFNLTVTDSAGATANTSVTTLLGRVALSCSNPIASVRISHDGPSWIIDSLAL
jgi:hypothetical protein